MFQNKPNAKTLNFMKKYQNKLSIKLFRLLFCLFRFKRNNETLCFGNNQNKHFVSDSAETSFGSSFGISIRNSFRRCSQAQLHLFVAGTWISLNGLWRPLKDGRCSKRYPSRKPNALYEENRKLQDKNRNLRSTTRFRRPAMPHLPW